MTPMSSVIGEIVLMAFTSGSTTSAMDLREMVDWVVRPRLLAIPGVAQVIPIGGEVRQFRVKPNPGQMMALDVSLETISHALHRFGANTAGGFVKQHARESVIRNGSPTRKPDDFRALVISQRGASQIAPQPDSSVELARQGKNAT